MNARVRSYEHSGVTLFTGLAVMAGGGAAAACGSGWLYGLAIYWIPFVYVAFFLPMALAALDFRECPQCHQLRLLTVKNVGRSRRTGRKRWTRRSWCRT